VRRIIVSRKTNLVGERRHLPKAIAPHLFVRGGESPPYFELIWIAGFPRLVFKSGAKLAKIAVDSR
jgi:hypothetical protein